MAPSCLLARGLRAWVNTASPNTSRCFPRHKSSFAGDARYPTTCLSALTSAQLRRTFRYNLPSQPIPRAESPKHIHQQSAPVKVPTYRRITLGSTVGADGVCAQEALQSNGKPRSPLESLADAMEAKLQMEAVHLPTILPINNEIPSFRKSVAATGEVKKSFFPKHNDRNVAFWLLGSAGLVFGIVVLGGLTRLTESGLSITEWKPVTGALPPMSAADWEENFAKYKDSPEYSILNPNMTLDEFKFIYYMEWAHRVWGRVIGLSFVIPAAYFIARRRVTPRMALKLVGISGMIGFQGFIGWWMVKSGLKDDLFITPGNEVPRVSQYRLTAHLCAAFTVYLAMLYNGLSILRENRLINNPALALNEIGIVNNPRLKIFRRSVAGLAVLAFVTAMSGGLVAGLDAGLIYNEFPQMGEGYKPPNSELFSAFYARDKEGLTDLIWRNMLENPSMVQFQHRCLAMTTFTSIVAFWLYARFGGGKMWKNLLTSKMRAGTSGVLHLVLLQVTLGISTLIYMVPTPIAAAHQAGSLALLTGIIVLGSRIHVPARLQQAVARKMDILAFTPTASGTSGVVRRTPAPIAPESSSTTTTTAKLPEMVKYRPASVASGEPTTLIRRVGLREHNNPTVAPKPIPRSHLYAASSAQQVAADTKRVTSAITQRVISTQRTTTTFSPSTPRPEAVTARPAKPIAAAPPPAPVRKPTITFATLPKNGTRPTKPSTTTTTATTTTPESIKTKSSPVPAPAPAKAESKKYSSSANTKEMVAYSPPAAAHAGKEWAISYETTTAGSKKKSSFEKR
ncbi:cytochrome oxidase assembly protein-domain-containing protein [Peziza echinospora]|nr:cytochrome oxidase assembly protein-domain-containing protein [Peziza echinospora]